MLKSSAISPSESTTSSSDKLKVVSFSSPISVGLPLPDSDVTSIIAQPKRNSAKAYLRESSKLKGLTFLSVTDYLTIEVEENWIRCDWDAKYSVKDNSSSSAGGIVFRATEELRCCLFNTLQNIVIHDMDDVAVARVSYKEKSCFHGNMVLAVYSPPQQLIGTAEESTALFVPVSQFVLRNQDGNHVFDITHKRHVCSATSFIVTSTKDKEEVARVTEKNRKLLRLQFIRQMSIRSKTLLLGLCIGTLHKSTNHYLSDN